MFHLPLSRDWIVSKRARRAYLACAIISILFTVFVITTLAIKITSGESLLLGAFTSLVLPVGVLASATVWVAMWFHWCNFFRQDGGRGASIIILILFGWMGGAIYYFFIYRRAREVRALDSRQAL